MGVINGERFAVMAGAGLDAVMIRDADGKLKDRFGRLAYVISGVRGTGQEPMEVKVEVDGDRWFEGRAGCLLFGSMGTLTGGLVAFPDADPTDGLLEVGVVTAGTCLEWARVVGRLVLGSVESSSLTQTTRGRKVRVWFDRPTPYELDGSTRPKVKKLKVRVKQAAVRFAVPSPPG